MRLSGFGWVNSKKSLLRLCLCLVLVGVITAGAVAFTAMSSTGEKLPTVQMCQAAPLQQNEAGYAPSAIAGNKPSIDVFKATPMVLDTPSSAAVYTFKVKNATNVQINEAGANIKTISNPSGAALQGTATGLPASAIATDDSGKFITVLTASNDNGSDQAELTLSLSEKLLASRLPAGQSEETGNQNSKYKPTWGPLIYHPVTPNPTTTTTLNEPKFFECPSDCDHCLRPDEAASQGFAQRNAVITHPTTSKIGIATSLRRAGAAPMAMSSSLSKVSATRWEASGPPPRPKPYRLASPKDSAASTARSTTHTPSLSVPRWEVPTGPPTRLR
jgi:hypothetical protein